MKKIRRHSRATKGDLMSQSREDKLEISYG